MKFRGTMDLPFPCCICLFASVLIVRYLWHLAAEQLLVCRGANAHCSSISSKTGLCSGYLMSTLSLEFSMFIGCFLINWKLCAAI